MPSWKKLVTSGSSPTFNNILATGNITASGNISASGDIYATNIWMNDTGAGSTITFGPNGAIVGNDDTDITNIESVYCDNIVHDGDTDTKIAFGTDAITLTAGGADLVTLTEATTNTIALGAAISTHITASGNISASGDITGDTIYGTLGTPAQTNINKVGTVGAGVWNGTKVASAYLDDDTAHKSTDQTFTGKKTFSAAITASGNISSSGTIQANGDFIVNSSGRVGINTKSPDYKLDVAGNVGINEYLYHNGDANTYLRHQTDQVDIAAGGEVLSLKTTGLETPGDITASGDISASVLRGTYLQIGNTQVAVPSSDIHIRKTGNAYITIQSTTNGNALLELQNNQTPDWKIQNKNTDGGLQFNSTNKTFFTIGKDDVDIIELSGSVQITGSLNTDGAIHGIPQLQYNTASISATGNVQGDIIKFGNSTTVAGAIYAHTGSGWTLAHSGSAGCASSSLGLAVGTNSTTHGMLLRGMANIGSAPGGDNGCALYLEAPGLASSNVPATSGHVSRVVGWNYGSDTIYFNPDNTWVLLS